MKKIIEIEQPDAVLPTLGGQTALNLSMELENDNVFDKNDKYLSWKTDIFYRNENKTKNIEGKDVGSGLFATLLTALAFEVFENSDLVINLFRKNSGNEGR